MIRLAREDTEGGAESSVRRAVSASTVQETTYRNLNALVPKTASSQNFPFLRSRATNGARYAAHTAMKPRSVLSTDVRTVIAVPSSGTIW